MYTSSSITCYCPAACDTSACQNGATCSNGAGMGEYSCKCVAGWTGTNCEISRLPADYKLLLVYLMLDYLLVCSVLLGNVMLYNVTYL